MRRDISVTRGNREKGHLCNQGEQGEGISVTRGSCEKGHLCNQGGPVRRDISVTRGSCEKGHLCNREGPVRKSIRSFLEDWESVTREGP